VHAMWLYHQSYLALEHVRHLDLSSYSASHSLEASSRSRHIHHHGMAPNTAQFIVYLKLYHTLNNKTNACLNFCLGIMNARKEGKNGVDFAAWPPADSVVRFPAGPLWFRRGALVRVIESFKIGVDRVFFRMDVFFGLLEQHVLF